jgi:Asp-tRNA(Asn)/Glu-tRNA(Gln) amidotransferase B subunit
MEILRQNPVNLYSFVGLITVPSNQKTGHKKLNKYDDVFSKKVNKTNQTLTIWLMSTVMKYLQKHSYDISGEHEASSLTLLSQLVNAVSFGGLSNLTSKNLLLWR